MGRRNSQEGGTSISQRRHKSKDEGKRCDGGTSESSGVRRDEAVGRMASDRRKKSAARKIRLPSQNVTSRGTLKRENVSVASDGDTNSNSRRVDEDCVVHNSRNSETSGKLDRRHLDSKKLDRRHLDSKKLDRRHLDSKKSDSKKLDSKELDSKTLDRRKLDNNKLDSKTLDSTTLDSKFYRKQISRSKGCGEVYESLSHLRRQCIESNSTSENFESCRNGISDKTSFEMSDWYTCSDLRRGEAERDTQGTCDVARLRQQHRVKEPEKKDKCQGGLAHRVKEPFASADVRGRPRQTKKGDNCTASRATERTNEILNISKTAQLDFKWQECQIIPMNEKRLDRSVVIDGRNLCDYSSSAANTLSAVGIESAVTWCLQRGHPCLVHVQPWMFWDSKAFSVFFSSDALRHRRILRALYDSNMLYCSVLRKSVDTHAERPPGSSYDDVNEMVAKCEEFDALICTNNTDQFEKCNGGVEISRWMQERTLHYFIDEGDFDVILDPGGKDGPPVDHILYRAE